MYMNQSFRRLIRLTLALLCISLISLLPACTRPPDQSLSPSQSQTAEPSATTPASSQPTVQPTPSPVPTPTPEPTPSPVPTPTPEITDPALLLVPLDTLPGYQPGSRQSDGSWRKRIGEDTSVRWWLYSHSNQLLASAEPAEPIAFGSAGTFTDIEGVLTFRGNHHRTAPAWGEADILEEKLEIVWTHDIGAISGNGSYWPGAGWTGQPLLVHWPEETRKVMGLNQDSKEKDLVEVFYPVFDGNIYCLDLETGQPTRDPLKVGFGFKGTASLDPRGYPLLFAGQGLNDTNGRTGAFRYRMFDLIQNKEVAGIPGKDAIAFRSWGAFDASALIDWKSDTLIEPGENGLLYRVQLNTEYRPDEGVISIDPVWTKLRYRVGSSPAYGIESSPVAWRNLIFFSDNDGNIICLDINSLAIVWVFETGDDADATMVLEESEKGVFLYHGNTIDKRGKASPCQLRKIDALTGQLVWQHDVPCVYESYLNGGLLASPLLGRDDLEGLVIFNVCKTTSHAAGTLLALDCDSGAVVWERHLDAYSWSSPLAIRSTSGKSYGVFADSLGMLHLFDPLTGEDLDTLSLGQNCEASPSAYEDRIVVATYARKIFCIRVR